jgi:ribonuclease III
MADYTPIDNGYEACERALDYRFRDRALLESALTHASGADHRLESNERMEFLGDAILGAIVCERLYTQYPEFLEGDLTKLKSVVVSRQTCAKVSRAMGLERFLILGKGMTTSPSVPPSVLADVFESLVAAIYLDSGRESAERLVDRWMGPEIEEAAASGLGANYKSQLQQLAQRDDGRTPSYHVVEERGPDHSKCFLVLAEVAGRRFQAAWGRTKKESEQRAAHNALCELRDEAPPHGGDLPSALRSAGSNP